MKKFKVAAAQICPVYLDLDATIQKAIDTINQASENGARLIVLPEAFVPGYPDWVWLIPNARRAELDALYVRLVDNSVTVGGEITNRLCEAAEQARINVVIGINERNTETSGTSLYNSTLLIGEDGNILHKHRKLIPTGGERLIWAQGAGDSVDTTDTSVGSVGSLICWENYMPLARVAMYEAGVQILAAPTWDKSPQWLVSMQHNAREGAMYVISACMPLRMNDLPDDLDFKLLYPEGREWINEGNSCIVDPRGKVLAGPLNKEEGILYADIDLDEVTAARRMLDITGHYARPDVFKLDSKFRDRNE